MQPHKILLATFFIFLVVACATPQQPSMPTSEPKTRSEDAIRLQSMCAVRTVSEVDDGISDAQSVALALALRCSREYQQATEAFGSANLDNEAQRRMFREDRNQTQEMIRNFLPIVMDYRAFNRKTRP